MKEKIDVFVRLTDRHNTRKFIFIGTIKKNPTESINLKNVLKIHFRENKRKS